MKTYYFIQDTTSGPFQSEMTKKMYDGVKGYYVDNFLDFTTLEGDIESDGRMKMLEKKHPRIHTLICRLESEDLLDKDICGGVFVSFLKMKDIGPAMIDLKRKLDEKNKNR